MIDRPNVCDRLRQGALASGVVSMIAGSYIVDLTGVGRDMREAAAASVTPLQPIGFAFSIWFPIFVGLIGLSLYHFTPRGATHPGLRLWGGWVAAACWTMGLWISLSQLTASNAVDLPGALLALSFLLVAYRKRMRQPEPVGRIGYWCGKATLGLVTGWIGVASFVVIAAAMKRASPPYFGMTEGCAGLMLLCSIGALTLWAIDLTKGRDWYFVGAIIWGLCGIATANLLRDSGHFAVAALALILACSLAAAALWRRQGRS